MKKVVITGSTGLFGYELAKCFAEEYEVIAPKGREELDITDTQFVIEYMKKEKPDLIVHSAGFRMVDEAEKDKEKVYSINIFGTKNIALAANSLDIPMVHISSDSVFDGETEVPYNEYDKVNPINNYGYSKMMAEQEVRTYCRKHFIIRVPLLFAAHGHRETNYIYIMKDQILRGDKIEYTTDQLCSPTYCVDAAKAIREIAESEYYGVYHVANEGIASRYEFYKTVAEKLGLQTDNLVPILQAQRKARRAKNTMFASIAYKNTFHKTLRDWHEALDECVEEIKEVEK